MAKTAWITDTELSSYLVGLGVSEPSGVDLQDAIDAAVAEWEGLTVSPFLEASSTTHTFSPNGTDTVALNQCFTEITSLKVWKVGSSSGSTLTYGSDYFYLRIGGSGPIYAIQFARYIDGPPYSIEITGKAGWGANIPLDAWLAVRDLSAMNVAETKRFSQGSVKKIKDDEVEVEYQQEDTGGEKSPIASLRTKALKTARSYQVPRTM